MTLTLPMQAAEWRTLVLEGHATLESPCSDQHHSTGLLVYMRQSGMTAVESSFKV